MFFSNWSTFWLVSILQLSPTTSLASTREKHGLSWERVLAPLILQSAGRFQPGSCVRWCSVHRWLCASLLDAIPQSND